MEKINQEMVWNELAEKWSEYRKKPVAEVIEFLNGKKGKILDLGCGGGRNFIKNDFIQIYGVDFSEKMLELAEEKSQKEGINAVLKKSGLEKLPFEDDFFDAALLISTLHCIEGENERKKALEEMFRVMKKNSEGVISVWNKDEKASLRNIPAKEGLVNWQKDGKNYQRYYYFYDKEELVNLLKSIGFRIIEIEEKKEDSKHAKRNIVVIVRK